MTQPRRRFRHWKRRPSVLERILELWSGMGESKGARPAGHAVGCKHLSLGGRRPVHRAPANVRERQQTAKHLLLSVQGLIYCVLVLQSARAGVG